MVTAEQIEAVALRLWSERGFHEVSVADVAAEAGVTARTIFRRYPAKADIVWGPLTASFQILADALGQTSPQAPLLERARTALVGMIRDGDVDPTARHRIRIVGRTPSCRAAPRPRSSCGGRASTTSPSHNRESTPSVPRCSPGPCRARHWQGSSGG